MATTRSSSKRSATEADLPLTDVPMNITPGAAVIPASHLSDKEASDLLAAGGPAPVPQIEGFTHPVEAVAHESTSHKAKRIATEASHTVQQAVTQGIESASVALDKAKVQASAAIAVVQEKLGTNKETVTQPPYNMTKEAGAVGTESSMEPTLGEKAKVALGQAQEALSHAADVTVAAAKTAAHKISEATHQVGPAAQSGAESLKEGVAHLQQKAADSGITQQVKDGAATVAASASAAASQVKAAVTHSTGAEDKQLSSASHLIEKRDGSLPVERNADEFPHGKHERDTSILLDRQEAGLTTPSAAVTSLKIDEQPLAKAQTDLTITSGNASINV